MKRDDDETHKQDSPVRRDAGNGADPAARDPRQGAAGKPSASVDPPADTEEPARSVIEEAVGRAVQAEERLVQAEGRIEWLESRNVCDEITGLLNRRGFGDALGRALARSRRYGETGALLLLDLSRYEDIIEEHGADAGDYALNVVANILLRQFRDVDYVARLEGARFAVLLVLIGQDDARRRAAMLKGYLDEIAVPWRGSDIAIQVRIGLVLYAQNDIAEDILERAEAELEERERRVARLRNPAE